MADPSTHRFSATLASLVLVLFVLMQYAMQSRLEQVQRQTRESTLCLLYQINVHRLNSYAADRAIAPPGMRLPAPPPGNVRIDPKVCADYTSTD